MDLKDYILPDAEKTFRSLRDQGLIDLDAPEKSKIVQLIDMGREAKKPNAVNAKLRPAERVSRPCPSGSPSSKSTSTARADL